MAGRPRKLSTDKQGEICALLHSGCTLAAAARYVDCSVLTIQREAGRNQEFCEKLRLARYSAELTPIHTLRNAAREDWRVAAWLLERTQPHNYAQRAASAFSPQEVAELLERVCEVIRQETRDAQQSARIKRRVMAIARSRIAHQDDNPFRPQLPAPDARPEAEPRATENVTIDAPTTAATSTFANRHDPISMPHASEAPQNATRKHPNLICAADIPPSNSRHFARANAS
jgi:hypothetical protein